MPGQVAVRAARDAKKREEEKAHDVYVIRSFVVVGRIRQPHIRL